MGSIYQLNPCFLYSQITNPEHTVYNESGKFTIYIYGTYVSSAELQNDISSHIAFLRDASVELSGGYGAGGEISFNPGFANLGLSFYLSSEYLKVNDDELLMRLDQDSSYINYRVGEEYTLIPLEAGLKWRLPVSTERFKIYIGGGGGVYFGDRTRTIAGLQSYTVSKKAGYSMNILAGLEYFVARNLSVDFEFKFREASFDNESRFNSDFVTVNGNNYPIENPINSRFIVDGTRISAGLKYHF